MRAAQGLEKCLAAADYVIWPSGEPPLVFFARMDHAAKVLELVRRGVADYVP